MIGRELASAWRFCRENGIKRTLLYRDTPILIQLGKYGMCGVLSVIVFLVVTTFGEWLFPCSFSEDLPERNRALNNIPLHFAAFLPSNFAAYALNRWLVFTPGKHSFGKEISLFTLISFLSFSLGELLPFFLVDTVAVNNTVAHLSFVISSAMINFLCRKFLIFKK